MSLNFKTSHLGKQYSIFGAGPDHTEAPKCHGEKNITSAH